MRLYSSHLNGTEGVKQMRVMSSAGTDASTFMLTGCDKVYDLLPIHPRKLPHQVHYCQPPVDTTHPQVL